MIKLDKMCFGYIKQPLCLKDVSFTLANGKTLGVLGGEGSGKSTLLRVLCGMEKQYAGKILIDGKELSTSLVNSLSISFLPSEPVLFNKTIKYNLDYLYKVNNIAPLAENKLKEIFEKFNFNFPLSAKIKKLSSADKKIFAMIRAYIKNAKNLIIEDQTFGENNEDTNRIKNAISVLTDRKNTSKCAILAFREQKSLIEVDRFLYLSFGKNYLFNSLGQIEGIDLYYLNYIDRKQKEYILLRNEGYFLNTFHIETEKKKNIIVLDEQIKLDKSLFEALDKAMLEEGDKMPVIVSYKNDADVDNLSHSDINKYLLKNDAFIFDKSTGDKLL